VNRIAKGFDFLSGVYDLMSGVAFAGTIGRAQRHFLREIPRGSRVLIVGGGTGKFIFRFLTNAEPDKVCYVEISKAMMNQAKANFMRINDRDGKVPHWHLGELNSLPDLGTFDVAITYFYLDLFDPATLKDEMRGISERLKPSGTWIFADFRRPVRFPMRLVANGMIKLMYLIFRMICSIPASGLPYFLVTFMQSGWEAANQKRFAFGMIEAILFKRKFKQPLNSYDHDITNYSVGQHKGPDFSEVHLQL